MAKGKVRASIKIKQRPPGKPPVRPRLSSGKGGVFTAKVYISVQKVREEKAKNKTIKTNE